MNKPKGRLVGYTNPKKGRYGDAFYFGGSNVDKLDGQFVYQTTTGGWNDRLLTFEITENEYQKAFSEELGDEYFFEKYCKNGK